MTENEILRQTSRSFYLTLRLLPRSMRPHMSLSYLLARATDTLADSSRIHSLERLEMLHAIRRSVGHDEIAGYNASHWCAPQLTAGENNLLTLLPNLWRRMNRLSSPERQFLEVVVDYILEGQIFDLERFHPGSAPLTHEELKRYAYLVAGSVGEFWTHLSAEKIHPFSHDPMDVMLMRGRLYGQALQLINILRDHAVDAGLERIYIQKADRADWLTTARKWLEEATSYCASLHSGRLRYVTLLPALLGWRTLAKIESHLDNPQIVCKVPRRDVRRWMVRSLPVWFSANAVNPLVRATKINEGPSLRR